MNRMLLWVVTGVLAVASGCRTNPPPPTNAVGANNGIGGDTAGASTNGTPADHGPTHDDRSMSLNGMH